MLNNISLPMVFAIIFLCAAAAYAAVGVRVLSYDTKSSLNRLFFLMCCALSLWALAYALAHPAPSATEALFWHRVSALGWGTMYSLTLHYFLVLTGRGVYLQKKSLLMLLYTPALITIILYGPVGSIALGQYELLNLGAGWVDVSTPGYPQRFFDVYYLCYSAISLGALLTWSKAKQDSAAKSTVRVVSLAYALTLVLATVTDLILLPSLEFPTPQLGVLLALITVGAFFRATLRHGFMREPNVSPSPTGQILTGAKQIRVSRYLALLFLVGSALNLSDYFLRGAPFGPSALFSYVLLVIGLTVFLLPHLHHSSRYKDNCFVTLVAGSYPLVVLYYANSPSSNTFWPAPLMFIIISTVFNHRRLLVMVTLSAIFTQIWLWLRSPEQVVMIQGADYVRRLAIYGLGALLAYYVNRVYVERLAENEAQTKLQRLVSEISASLVGVNPENLGERIDHLLEQLGRHFTGDRSYLFVAYEGLSTVTRAYEWCSDGVEPALEQLGAVSASSFSWWKEHLAQSHIVHIPEVAKLPQEATPERELFERRRVKSLLAVPVVSNGRFHGFLGLDSMVTCKNWEVSHQEALGILANLISDALVKVQSEETINHMAYYDGLTGLPNRALFTNRLNQSIALAQRSEKYLGLLFMDLDSFKGVNDTMGHERGDKLLTQVAERMSERVRHYDTVCRFGGDEFLVLFPQMDQPEDIQAAAEKVMHVFSEPMMIEGQEIFVTASGGTSVYPADGLDAETLIRSADLAMYAAKDQGKNRISSCTKVMKEAVAEKMQLTNHLYRALDRQELVLHYQPQVSVATQSIVGVEALVRWQHPTRGLISPGLFIPLAEETGLINPLGQWVLETACRQNKAWQDKGLSPVVMAVNVSVEQFRNPRLVDVVAQALSDSNLAPSWLELEITESTAIREEDYIITVLSRLKGLGVSISIDDFGTEYSSLSRLKALPIDRIKIAMEYVHALANGPKDEAIAMVIISLARSLGLQVVAEGVETESQLHFLAERLCDSAQGFYFHKPMPAERIEALMLGKISGQLVTIAAEQGE